ncbi:phosphoribosylglycinamide formyltransferase [Clostridium rectalis]|uniref:phosphoribosylglycinamide formyltransferase n=1 Tax=Clostridium rectalis TaxID=2040295 RepID=UPI000F637A81|nr:phosphoribosylglycinamide formyltransferase [Clostridium rectalis]
MEKKLKLAVLVSGRGSNLRAILDNIKAGNLNCEIEIVISDNHKAYALSIARKNGIKTKVLDKEKYGDNISQEIFETLQNKVDLIVLAGWLSILKGDLIKEFKNKIINIHPSLVPCFCGKGMYGIKVHKSVIDSGVKFSGCTVHFVYEGIDNGPIILQKIVPVNFNDTAEDLQNRVSLKEHVALSEAINLIEEGRVEIIDKKVKLKECLN